MRMIDNVIARNKEVGGTFFDSRTVLYFKNKVHPTLYGNKYFISYDVMEDDTKVYAIREVLASGLIKRVTNGLSSKDEAKDAIRNLLGDIVTA
jgi:hypothetical protein